LTEKEISSPISCSRK